MDSARPYKRQSRSVHENRGKERSRASAHEVRGRAAYHTRSVADSGSDDANTPKPPHVADDPPAPRPRHGRPTILVIDDERANLKLAQVVLESEGFDVQVATDAISAFEVLKTSDPALIVMDIQLPGMDGWELTRRLKHNVATSHIPVIALTAYGTKGDEERAREAGCAAYYAKPVSTRDLPAIIRRFVGPDR